jgi:DNA polymerase-3 subunit delta
MGTGTNYLFCGPEIGERQDAVSALRKGIAKSYGTLPEETSFYVGETPLSDLVSILRNGSLFSSARLFLIKNADQLKKKEEVDLLVSYLTAPQDDTTLICVSDEISVDKRLDAAFPRENKRIFWELFENRKTEWIAGFFRREGFQITDDGIETILELVENNTDALKRECGRLILFLEKGAPVTQEIVEKWLAHTREESAFTLFSRIAEGDLERAIETLHTLLGSKESPQAILAGLNWCFHRLYDYLDLVQRGPVSELDLKKIGLVSKKAQRDYQQAAKRYTLSAVRHVIGLLADQDVRLRALGSAPETIIMDIFIYKIISILKYT